ncbi:MAG: serine/threonine-protein kinase [Thermoanaerobaculia bacterium]
MTRAEEGAAPAAGGPSATAARPAAGARGPRGERGVPTPRLPEEGELLGGRFLLLRLLGAGATGVVFEALDEVARQRVALKVLRPESVLGSGLERLRREVRLSRPGHPHVVRLNDLHEADGFLLLSMELVDGESLAVRLSSTRRCAVEEVVSLGRQVAGALAYLHGNGLVHRDVKPGNLLLDARGSIKLCDLGLLRPVEHGLTLTVSELVVGTPAYMAPEQASGRDLTGATDVYALGLTLWQALTGSVPLSGSTAVETLTRRQKERPPRLRPLRPDCPRWLERLLRRMLSPRAPDRPAAAEVEAALARTTFRPLPLPRSLAAAAIAILVLAGAGAGARALVLGRTVRFETEGNTVRGVDGRGRTTWTHRFESPVQTSLRMDIDGDGKNELVVTACGSGKPVTRLDRIPASEVSILDANGVLRTRLRPEDAVPAWPHPFLKRFKPTVQAEDLDGDGVRELVAICHHWSFYPASVFVFWPRTGEWDHLLDHWGHLYAILPVPGRAVRLRFLAINNAIAYALVLGEVEFLPPWKRARHRENGTLLMAQPGLGAEDPESSWTAYTLLSPSHGARLMPAAQSLGVAPDGGTVVRFSSVELRFDARGDPADGPNAGQDLSALRLEFATAGTLFNRPLPSDLGAAAATRTRERYADRFRPLLREAHYRLAFDLQVARLLAAGGAPGEAADILRRTDRDFPGEEAAYQLAGFLALGGDLEEASRTLRRVIREGESSRSSFDAPALLLRVAAETGSSKDVATAVEGLTVNGARLGEQPGLPAVLRARANVLMDRVTEADGEVRSWPLASDGDALAALARWRLGRSRADDVAAMTAFVESARDGEQEGRLALAAALLAAGRAREAASRCEALESGLLAESRGSFERLQQLRMARAIRAKALLAAGKATAASDVARDLLASSRPGLVWTNLAREVLAAAPPAARAAVRP